jgi:endoglycosylceramidase
MHLSSLTFISVVFIQMFSPLAAEEFDELHVDNSINQIVDSKNRIRIFHGINLVCKHPPWYYTKLLDEKYAENLGKWGLNVVRLGTMWSGIEPSEGEYSQAYVNKLKTIITNFEKHGIWVILDMHQDVAAKDFGTYDGFPPWLNTKLSETAKKDFPWPLEKVDNWFCGYLTYAACNSYQQLYDNYYEAADRMALAWKFIATSFKDHKNILGYDLLNEPWGGNIYKDGSLLSPAVAAKRNLIPLYEKIVSRIREVDSKTLIFWETVPYSHWAPNLKLPFLNNNIGDQLRTPAGLELFLSMTSSACGGLKIKLDASDRAL